MADWYGMSRSNYFKVKDVEKYRKLCDKWNITFIEKEGKVGFLCEEYLGGLPSYTTEPAEPGEEYENGEKELDFDDFINELADLLIDGEVAIMFEVGAEKLRYITGFAMAVNSKQETKIVNLEEIYERAKELGTEISAVEY